LELFIIRQICLCKAREQLGFNEADHFAYYTAKTDYVNAGWQM